MTLRLRTFLTVLPALLMAALLVFAPTASVGWAADARGSDRTVVLSVVGWAICAHRSLNLYTAPPDGGQELPTLLAETAGLCLPAPFGDDAAQAYLPMDGGKGPIRRLSHQSMFDGIAPAIFNVPPVILFVSDRVFPESPLPNAGFPFCNLACRAGKSAPDRPRKAEFDLAPSLGIVAVPLRQGPDSMHMVR